MIPKQLRKTSKIELVETHNLALSFNRLRTADPPGDRDVLARALMHALQMSWALNSDQLKQVREALKLP